jgi:PilZ domain
VRIPVALLNAADRRIGREVLSQEDQAEQLGPGPATSQAVRVERRRERRYPANEIVEVHLVGGRGERFPATILDVSRSGLRIEVGQALSRGTQLELVLRNRAIIFGESCYARPKDGLYQVGISIESIYFAKTCVSQHVDIKLLRQYSLGRSLEMLQVLEVRDHLLDCEACRGVLAGYEKMAPKEGGESAWSQDDAKI